MKKAVPGKHPYRKQNCGSEPDKEKEYARIRRFIYADIYR